MKLADIFYPPHSQSHLLGMKSSFLPQLGMHLNEDAIKKQTSGDAADVINLREIIPAKSYGGRIEKRSKKKKSGAGAKRNDSLVPGTLVKSANKKKPGKEILIQHSQKKKKEDPVYPCDGTDGRARNLITWLQGPP